MCRTLLSFSHPSERDTFARVKALRIRHPCQRTRLARTPTRAGTRLEALPSAAREYARPPAVTALLSGSSAAALSITRRLGQGARLPFGRMLECLAGHGYESDRQKVLAT